MIRAGSNLGFEVQSTWASETEAAGRLTFRFAAQSIWRSFDFGPEQLCRMLEDLSRAWPRLRAGEARTIDEVFGAHAGMVPVARSTVAAGQLALLEPGTLRFSSSGVDMVISNGTTDFRWPLRDVLHSLIVLGDGIAERLRAASGNHEGAAAAWEERDGGGAQMARWQVPAAAG